MKTTIYLHIGSCKTGTSYIQNFLDLNRQKLFSDHACLYPNFSSSDFISGRCHNHVQWSKQILNDEQKLIDDIKRLVHFCDQNQLEKVLLSNEGWLIFLRDAADLLMNINKVRNFDLIVICYLRRIDHWIESAWKQWGLKEYKTIDEFISDPQYSNRYQLYLESLETWANIFGDESIIVRPYEKKQLKKGLIFDFLSSVGIDPRSDQWIDPEPSNLAQNPGFTHDVLEMLHYSRGLLAHKHDNRLFDLFYELLGDEFQKPPFDPYSFLSPAQRRELISKNQIYEKLIAERFMKRSDGKIFYEQLPNLNDKSYEPFDGLDLENAIPILVKMIDENNRLIHTQKNKIDNLQKQINQINYLEKNSKINRQPNATNLDKKQRKSRNNLSHLFYKLKFLVQLRDYFVVVRSGLFNRDFYRQNYSDNAFAKFSPIMHYLTIGWKEDKNPSPNFDTRFYLENNPDVKDININPFCHYIRWGKQEGRKSQETIESNLD